MAASIAYGTGCYIRFPPIQSVSRQLPLGLRPLHYFRLKAERVVEREPPRTRQEDHQKPRDEHQVGLRAGSAALRRDEPDVDLYEEDRDDEVGS